MSNLTKISQKILDDAQAQAESLLAEARTKLDSLLEAEQKAAAAEAEDQLKKERENAVVLREHRLAHARLEARDKLLSARQNLIGQVLSAAETRLKALPDEELSRLIAEALALKPLAPGDQLLIPPGAKVQLPAGVKAEEDPSLCAGFSLHRANGVIEKHDYCELLRNQREVLESQLLEFLTGAGS